MAAAAISALAVTGLPFLATSASAEPNAAQYGAEEVQLLSQFSGTASTKNDGQNTTVRLEAGAGTGVSSVTFQYNTGNPDTWVTIATVTRNDDGAFAHEWDATGLNGATVDLRAFETGTDPLVTADERLVVPITGGGVADESVNLNDASAHGAFQSPYTDGGYVGPDASTILSGTSSAETGTVDLVHFFGDPDGAPAGTATLDEGVFSGIADISGYDFTGSPDELSFGAQLDSDDVEAYTLYQQTIGTVTASPTNVNQPAGDPTATITITVTDQNGAPIANAEVREQDGTVVDYTDENGQVEAEQGSGTQYYYANQTDGDPYEPTLGDKRSEDVTVAPYNPEPTSLDADSNDGAAFDFDEYSTGDITVQVKDQNGNDADTSALQTLSYYWIATPFDGTAAQRFPAAPAEYEETGSTDGEYTVDFPVGGPEGTYELFASLDEVPVQGGGDVAESKVLTVKAGESQVAYDEESPEVAPAGTTEAVTGKLVLDDGTGLGGRGLDFNYTSTGNATIQESQGTANDGIITTAADGSFSFNVVDPAVAAPATQPTERGTLSVEPVAATNDSDSVGADIGPDDQEVVFAADATPDDSEITLGGDTGDDAPGEVKMVTVAVDDTEGPGGAPVTNTLVTLTVDEGYFTNSTGTADFGQEITVATDDSGDATAYLSIERNEGFDDDGDVTSTVTATSGDAADAEEYEWTTDGTDTGTVDLVFSDEQTVGVLPMAPFETEVVYFDVFAYDEFGNPIDGVDVTLDGDFVDDNTITTDLQNNQDTYAWQNSAGSEEYTVTWEDAVDNPAPAPNTDAEDSETIDWYGIEVDSATLTASGTDPHPVGSTVTMTYTAIDQHGEPIHGYEVDFFRAGPDNTNDGEPQTTRFTNAKGEAYYVFQGEVAGNAVISTVLYDTQGNLVPEGQTSDTVTFGTEKVNAALALKGKNTGARPDKLFANAIRKTAGATVTLFRKKNNGEWKKVAQGVMNDKGNKRFKVADPNGRKFSRYKAVVEPTDETRRGKGKKSVR